MYPGITRVELRDYSHEEELWIWGYCCGPGEGRALSQCGVLEVRFELHVRSEILFQRARELVGDVLLGRIDCIDGDRIVTAVQRYPEPPNRVRTYKKVVPRDRIVDPAGVMQREVAIEGCGTSWLGVARPSALDPALARDMACAWRIPVLLVGSTWVPDALERAADILEAAVERSNVAGVRLHRVVAAATRAGWMVGVRHVDSDTESGSARIYGPHAELERARRRVEIALSR